MTSSSGTPQRRFDPVVTEIIRNGMFAATEEMERAAPGSSLRKILAKVSFVPKLPP